MPRIWKDRKAVRALVVTPVMCLGAVANAQQNPSTGGTVQQSASTTAVGLVLHPGDAIKLTVWRVPELNGEYTVAPDGTLAHPAFASMVVAGVPLRRVQAMLDSAARVENTGARVVMQPLLHVVVTGEVRSPNLYKFPAGTSVMEAVVLAGGPTDQGDMTRLELYRNGQITTFNLTDAAGPAAKSPVMSDDQLRLERERASYRQTVLPVVGVVGTVASVLTLVLRRR